MSTNEPGSTKPGPRVNIFAIGLLAVAGLVFGGLAIANQAWISAVVILVVMFGLGAGLLVFSRRSDTVAMLADDVHEERNVHIHRRASIVTLNILAGVIVVAGIVDIIRGGDGDPYFWLAAVSGVTYVISLLVINRRS